MAKAKDWLKWLHTMHNQRLLHLRAKFLECQKEQVNLPLSQDTLNTFIREHREATR